MATSLVLIGVLTNYSNCITIDADTGMPVPVLMQGLTLLLTPFLQLHLGEQHTERFPERLSP